MNRIDRLILKAMPVQDRWQRLKQDNPYMGKTCDELLDMLCPVTSGGYTAPPMRTPEWNQFMYAMLHAEETGELEE